ncbi:hypothetical protein Tco_0642401 [Tanacetum coccineum]
MGITWNWEEMKRLKATGEYTEDEINALARWGKLCGHIPGVGRVLPSRATSRPSMSAPDKSLKSMHRKVDFMMSLFRSDSKYSDMFKEFESGGASGSGRCGDDEESGDDEDDDGESLPKDSPATCRWGKVCHRGTNCLTEKRVGPTSSLGIIDGDCIPDEDSPVTIPQRHFDGDSFPQRHVAGESPEMLLGKTPIVVVEQDDRNYKNQQYQEPFLADVIDTRRTVSAGEVEIGAFRTYPEG